MRSAVSMLVGLALLLPSTAGSDADADEPRLSLRTARRVAFSPIDVFVVAELEGGDDLEEYYCPGLVWDWGDGSRSAVESDCPPFEPGDQLQRHFTAYHVYRHAGNHRVRLILHKANRAVASASVTILVHSRFG